jgi:hypothetical protein
MTAGLQAQMYLRKCRKKTSRATVRNSQIRRTLNQEPVSKMFDRRELRWIGHLITIDSNRKPTKVWKTRVERICRGGGSRIEWEEHTRKLTGRKSDDLARGD